MVIFKLMNLPLYSFLFLKISDSCLKWWWWSWTDTLFEVEGKERQVRESMKNKWKENLSGYIFEWWTFGCGIMIHTRSSSPTLVMTFFIHFLLHLIFISSQTFSVLSFSPFPSERLCTHLTILANHQPTFDPSISRLPSIVFWFSEEYKRLLIPLKVKISWKLYLWFIQLILTSLTSPIGEKSHFSCDYLYLIYIQIQRDGETGFKPVSLQCDVLPYLDYRVSVPRDERADLPQSTTLSHLSLSLSLLSLCPHASNLMYPLGN